MPTNCLSALYKHIIQVENKNVGLKVGGAQTYHCPPNQKSGGAHAPLAPPLPTPVIYIYIYMCVCVCVCICIYVYIYIYIYIYIIFFSFQMRTQRFTKLEQQYTFRL